jgi:electron transfer flavoprotein beta subunit
LTPSVRQGETARLFHHPLPEGSIPNRSKGAEFVIQVVCIKQVADTETRVKIAADGRSLDPAGVTWILNPYDEFAVEQALRVKEQDGSGEVVVLALGGAGVATTLRNALAMGADRAIHLKTDAVWPDGLTVANALAAAIQPLAPGIVWCGRQAIDDDAAQVGPMLAERLGLPCVTSIATFERTGDTVVVGRDVEGGREIVEATLPALLTTDKGLNEPRYASLKGIMAAKKKPLEEQAVTLEPARLEVVALELPAARGAGRIVGEGAAAVPELVRVLRDEAKLL